MTELHIRIDLSGNTGSGVSVDRMYRDDATDMKKLLLAEELSKHI